MNTIHTAVPSPRFDRNLNRRASLNALAALVDYGARILILVVLAPLMLRSLGPAGYGAWQVIQRLVGHATPAGGRPGEALKWVVAQSQASEDDQRKRQQVGTAVAVWALFLPLVGAVGLVLAWFAPALVKASESEEWTVRGTAALLVVNLMLVGVATVPQSVLQGENLGYRRLGLSTGILFLGAGITACALWAGWGLLGLAATTLVTTSLSGLTYLQIVRRQVSWWGWVRPVRGAVKAFVGLSWWFLLWNLVMQVMKGGDLIVLSAVVGTTAVATYSLTSLVPQAVSDIVFVVISATMPGLGGLVGAGELGRAAKVRSETLVIAWLLAASAGATVIAWLPAFLALWVGSEYDAGGRATVLICVMVLQFALIRVDSNIIDVTLQVRAKVLLGVLSAALSVVLGVLLVGPADLGIAGLVAAFVIGRLPVTVAYPLLVARLLHLPHPFRLDALLRPAVASVALFAAGSSLRGVSEGSGWLSLMTLGSLTAVVATAVAYRAGLTRNQRRDLRARVLRVVRAA